MTVEYSIPDGAELREAVLTVGCGRGFVIAPEHSRFASRYVITAAHCLPAIPDVFPVSLEGKTYQQLLGPLGSERIVWAECLFVDPIADIAVLGNPDNQELWKEAEVFEQLVSGLTSLKVGAKSDADEQGWALSLDGVWFSGTVTHVTHHSSGPLWMHDANRPIEGGMSGSPILNANGYAIGVISTGNIEPHGPHPRLMAHLPGWLLAELGV